MNLNSPHSSYRRSFCLAAPLLHAQASESAIIKHLDNLRSRSPEQRPDCHRSSSPWIFAPLPAGPNKVELAYNLASLSTEGDAGHETLQAVADTLAKALAESPVPAKGDQPPALHRPRQLVRYEHVTATLDDPLFAKAAQTLADEEADVQKADFTLKDLKGKNVTLSELRGKIVMVNFWATWCGPCTWRCPTSTGFTLTSSRRAWSFSPSPTRNPSRPPPSSPIRLPSARSARPRRQGAQALPHRRHSQDLYLQSRRQAAGGSHRPAHHAPVSRDALQDRPASLRRQPQREAGAPRSRS